MDIRTSYDTRGKLLLADISPQCRELTYVLKIKSPASPEQVQEMVRLIDKGCHTINTIRNPVPVSGRLILNDQELEIDF